VVPGAASHPRYYGSFPRVLGRYVREQKALTLEDAVRKMSGLPAATIGMVDRGLLAVGMAADVVVFNPDTIADHATFEEPTLLSEGVRFVLVNGTLAVKDADPTPVRTGKALRRGEHMPTRPMTSGSRTIARRTSALALDVTQSANARRASGTFRYADAAQGIAIDMKEFGVLQTADRWASFTGVAALDKASPETSIAVIVDGEDVFIAPQSGSPILVPARRNP
jgi:hypothetical protein